MSPTLVTFVFELINVLLLIGVLGWLFFKPVRAALQSKLEADEQRRDQLAAREADVERQRAEVDLRRQGFDTDMAQLQQAHVAAATQEAAAILAQAHEAAERERDAVTRTFAHLERAQLGRLSAAVAAATRESVARLLATLSAPDLDVSLVHAACRQLAAVDGRHLGAVLIESAHPLDDAARATMTAALGGRAPSTEFRVVPDLGAGLRVVTAKGLIDASARGIAQEAERILADALTVSATGATT